MNNNTNFFDRMMEEASENGYNTVPELCDALGYKSPEKLYRLKRIKDSKPSFEIIQDLTNLFVSIDLHYLITGIRKETKAIEGKSSFEAEEVLLNKKILVLKSLFASDNKEILDKLDSMIEMFSRVDRIEDKLDKIAILYSAEKELEDAKKDD